MKFAWLLHQTGYQPIVVNASEMKVDSDTEQRRFRNFARQERQFSFIAWNMQYALGLSFLFQLLYISVRWIKKWLNVIWDWRKFEEVIKSSIDVKRAPPIKLYQSIKFQTLTNCKLNISLSESIHFIVSLWSDEFKNCLMSNIREGNLTKSSNLKVPLTPNAPYKCQTLKLHTAMLPEYQNVKTLTNCYLI